MTSFRFAIACVCSLLLMAGCDGSGPTDVDVTGTYTIQGPRLSGTVSLSEAQGSLDGSGFVTLRDAQGSGVSQANINDVQGTEEGGTVSMTWQMESRGAADVGDEWTVEAEVTSGGSRLEGTVTLANGGQTAVVLVRQQEGGAQ